VFSQNSSTAPPASKRNFGGQKSLFRHPAGTGKCPRSHLHRSPSVSIAVSAVSIDLTDISINLVVSYDEDGVVLPRG
jgi:hypothetical protein